MKRLRTKTVTFSIILLFVFGCKKDKLKGDTEFLIGKWNWTHTIHTYDLCDEFPDIEETLTPSTEGDNYSITFHKRGKIEFFKNGESIEKNRIVIAHCETLPTEEKYFLIDPDNDENNRIGGFGTATHLRFSNFPFAAESSCKSYTNHFTKE